MILCPAQFIRKICIVLFATGLLGLAFTEVNAQTCSASKDLAKQKLGEYLEKKLALELSSQTVRLITQWRTDYANDTLLNDEVGDARGRIPQQEQASEQAEVDYQEASQLAQDICQDGQ